jgi:hypothetical protein
VGLREVSIVTPADCSSGNMRLYQFPRDQQSGLLRWIGGEAITIS